METSRIIRAAHVFDVDPAHSAVGFKVRHLGFSRISGTFAKFDAQISFEPGDLSTLRTEVVIDASSIDTHDGQRDRHLKSSDFFDVEKHKELTFKSTSFKQKEDDEYELKGILTIKGNSKEVALEVEFGGINKDPWGNEKAGFSVEGKINRKDWGLNWNAALETGGVLVSEEVKIFGELQFVKQS